MAPGTVGESRGRERRTDCPGRHLKDWLALVAREPAPYNQRFRDQLAPEIVAEIESVGAATWLPTGHHVAMADALREAFGRAREHDYYRRAFGESLRLPVLGPLFQVGLRLFALDPAMCLRWASKGWDASFRNLGAARSARCSSQGAGASSIPACRRSAAIRN